MNKIMGISRLRTGTDGRGITTLVTFYGCPLKCKYCINDICHEDGSNGSAYTPKELLDIVKIDDIYFRMSGGGVTFGGGEPLLNADYIKEFARIAPKEWNIRIETSLNVPQEEVVKLLPYVKQWIIDVKDMNENIYRKYTGISNKSVIKNLAKLVEAVGPDMIHLRFPLIPEFNSEEDVQRSLKEFEQFNCKKEVFEYIHTVTIDYD